MSCTFGDAKNNEYTRSWANQYSYYSTLSSTRRQLFTPGRKSFSEVVNCRLITMENYRSDEDVVRELININKAGAKSGTKLNANRFLWKTLDVVNFYEPNSDDG